MNIYNMRQLLKTTSIYNLQLKVVYYGRVSTDKEEQQNSIMNQQDHFEELIRSNPKWQYCGGYIDNGISGIHTNKREQFQQMLTDAQNEKFDLIITKEISRFARNTLDSIQYTRQLLSYGVCVWFQNDNINTIDEDSELRLTIMAGVAQDEIRKLSSRIKFGHNQAIKNGVVLGNSLLYGYNKKDGRLVIDEEQAPMIRLIFEKYATGEWTTPKIEKLLYEQGYRSHRGGKINRGVINHIIKNPKYKGYYAGGKVKVVDMFTKKQEFLPEEEWNMFKDDGSRVPAIVDEETWELANKYLKMRSDMVKSHRTSYKEDNLFTGKIFCANDNAPYWMKNHTIRGRLDPSWVCSHRIKNGMDSCSSFPVSEKELRIMLAQLINKVAPDIEKVIEQYIALYKKAVINEQDINSQIQKARQKMDNIRKKMDKILDYNLSGAISDDEFLKRNTEYNSQLIEYEKLIQELEEQLSSGDSIEDKFKILSKNIKDLSEIQPVDFNRGIIENLIDKIIIEPTGDKKANIKFYLKYGDVAECAYDKSMGCSDNIFLKMIYEQTTVFYRDLRSCMGHKMKINFTYSLFL